MTTSASNLQTAYTSQVFPIMPDTRAFENLGSTGEPAYKAIAELVDNSIDARAPGQRVTVEVFFKTRRNRVTEIVIQDDAQGMSQKALVSAFTIGRSVKRDPRQIGRFGMGLKTAVASLGRSWTVTTATAGCENSHRVSENLDAFVKANRWEMTVSEVPKEGVGTRIVIERCDHINATTFERDLNRQLGNLFRHFLLSGELSLFVNDETVEVEDIPLIEDTLVTIDETINGKAVRGWVGLRTFGSNEYGFSLIRHNRVIERSVKLGFNPHPSVLRVVGEIHLADFDTNHHKTAFNRVNDDWAALEERIGEIVRPVIRKAQELSNRDRKRINKEVEKLINDSLEQLMHALQQDELAQETEGRRRDEAGALRTTERKEPSSRDEQDAPPQEDIDLQYERRAQNRNPQKASPLEKLNASWQFVADGLEARRHRWEMAESQLVVYINIDHPAFPEASGQYSWGLQSLIESLAAYYAQTIAERAGVPSASVDAYDQVLDRMWRVSAQADVLF